MHRPTHLIIHPMLLYLDTVVMMSYLLCILSPSRSTLNRLGDWPMYLLSQSCFVSVNSNIGVELQLAETRE